MTKTTALPLLSLFAAFAVQACAAPTADDVSSDPMTPANEATAAAKTDDGPAMALAGKFGESSKTMSAGIEQPAAGQVNAGEEVHAQLFIESRKQTYDVLDYSFGIASNAQVGDAFGTKLAAPPSLSDLNLTVVNKAGVPSLARDVFNGKPIGVVVLRQRDALGKYVDVAKFDGAVVTNVLANASGDIPSESVAIHMQAMRVQQGLAWVSVNAATGETTCSTSCPCEATAGQIGPYVQTTSSMIAVMKGSKRVESLAVSVSTPAIQDPYSGMTKGMPQLDGMSVTSAFEISGMCAVYHAAKGTALASVKLGVAAYSTKEPRESTSWEACFATVKNVSFSSRFDSMAQNIDLGAAGLMRTDREWSPVTSLLTSSTTYGWSFAKNASIAACGETF
jgi:hypothetical protein